MGTIAIEEKAKGEVRFRAEVRRDGKRLTKRFKRKTDAKDWIKETETQIYRGEHIPQLKRHTVAEAIDRYLLEVLPLKRPGTQELHRSQLLWFKEKIGHMRLQRLSSGDLATIRETLKNEQVQRKGHLNPSNRSASTLNRYFQVFNHCMNLAARDWGWIQNAPTLSKLKEPIGRTRFLTEVEAARLMRRLEQDRRQDVWLISLICLTLGSRLNETCALQWHDIGFDSMTLTFKITKTGTVRTIPLPPGLHAKLLNWRERSNGSAYLFPTSVESKRPYVYDSVKKRFREVCDELKLHDVVIHSLRHTAASWATQNNVNRKAIAELLGHANVSTTDRYSHLQVDHLRPVVSMVEDRLENKSGTNS